MGNLIYQYWDGEIRPGAKASVENIEKYAERIGAEYLFEDNPRFVTNLGKASHFYGAFKPIYDEAFHQYDNVLYLDTDIFAVDGLEESIFDNFSADVGSCTEPFQPENRAKTRDGICGACDETWAEIVEAKWGAVLPRTPKGLLKVYNSGVVLWSRRGLDKARERFVLFRDYIKLIRSYKLPDFYAYDQNYLQAMQYGLDHIELDNEWNRTVHFYKAGNDRNALHDPRTSETKFVHIQLRGAGDMNASMQWRITNMPSSVWRYAN